MFLWHGTVFSTLGRTADPMHDIRKHLQNHFPSYSSSPNASMLAPPSLELKMQMSDKQKTILVSDKMRYQLFCRKAPKSDRILLTS